VVSRIPGCGACDVVGAVKDASNANQLKVRTQRELLTREVDEIAKPMSIIAHQISHTVQLRRQNTEITQKYTPIYTKSCT